MHNPPDILDQAALETERQLNEALANRVQYVGHSLTECEECDLPIPLLRREAVPGVRLCLDCQELVELREVRK